MQENDIERAANLNRDHLDYLVEESWRWAFACEHSPSSCNTFLSKVVYHSASAHWARVWGQRHCNPGVFRITSLPPASSSLPCMLPYLQHVKVHESWTGGSLKHACRTEVAMMTAVFIGLTMGLCAFLVDVSLETLNNWKFGAVNSIIRSRGGFWRPYLAFIGICLLYSGRALPACGQRCNAAQGAVRYRKGLPAHLSSSAVPL